MFAIFIYGIDKKLESLQETKATAVSTNDINF